MSKEIVILSPHLDDAVLSLGEHILKWVSEHKKVKIITIFSSFRSNSLPEYTKEYLKKSGSDLNLKNFEKKRKSEDKKALEMIGVSSVNLDFTDGGFRTFQKNVIYKKSEELFSENVSALDKNLSKQLTLKLSSYISDTANVYIPYGLGGHADHIIVRKVGEKISKNIYYYADMPYGLTKSNWSIKRFFNFIKHLNSVRFSSRHKKQILNCYESQMNVLFKRYPVIFLEITTKGYR